MPHSKKPELMLADRWYIETRVEGFPWTRQGCNPWFAGKYYPYEGRALADENIRRLKNQDDPMWTAAEYRLVPGS